jgi:hypothetical protein
MAALLKHGSGCIEALYPSAPVIEYEDRMTSDERPTSRSHRPDRSIYSATLWLHTNIASKIPLKFSTL